MCPVQPSLPTLFSNSDRRAPFEQAIFPGDRSGSFSPFAECERPAQFVAVFSRDSMHATGKFGVRNIGDLGQVTTRMEECITWLALHPGSAGKVFTMTLKVRSSVDYGYMEKCEKRKCIEMVSNFFLQVSGQLRADDFSERPLRYECFFF